MIDRESPLSLFEQVKRSLEEQINCGALTPGDALPADREICERYGVSRITVTRALGELARQGLIERMRGRRSVVSARRVTRPLDELIGLTEILRRQGLTTHSHLLSRDTVAADALPPGRRFPETRREAFVRLRRLRYVSERRAAIHTSYLPERLGAEMGRFDLESESFYSVFERVLGRRVGRRELAMVPVVADSEIASLLGVERHSAHFCVRGQTYMQDGELIEITESIFHGEIFEFRANLQLVRANAA